MRNFLCILRRPCNTWWHPQTQWQSPLSGSENEEIICVENKSKIFRIFDFLPLEVEHQKWEPSYLPVERERIYDFFMIFLLLCSCPRKGWQRIFPDHWNIWIKGTARIFLLTGPLAEPDKRRPSLQMTARSYSWTTWCDRRGDLQRIIMMIIKEWSWSSKNELIIMMIIT